MQAIFDEFIGDDPESVRRYEEHLAHLNIGLELNRLRTEAGLTLKEVAEKVGTQSSAISRLEQADYDGHSLSMLRKVAAVFGRRVVVSLPPANAEQVPANRFKSEGRATGIRKPKANAAAAKGNAKKAAWRDTGRG
jgi:transcriptional regulator with XRE-family HTH domain